MRTRNALTAAIALLALSGCNGGGGSDRASSAAAISTATPAPTTSTTTPGTTPVTPPNNGLLTDALVTSFQMDEVVHLDAATGQTSLRWATGNGPTDVATWGNDVYVANTLSQNVTVVDRLANAVVTNVDVTTPQIISTPVLNLLNPLVKPLVRPTGVAVTPNGLKAYSANLVNLVAIDTTTNLATKSISGLDINFANVLNTLLTSGFNLNSALQSLYQQPIETLGIAKVAATNDMAVATCMLSGRLMRVSVATDTQLPSIDLRGTSSFPAPIGVAIARNKAYVACALSQETVVVDLVTGTIRARIRGGMVPVDVTTNPSEDRIYVANVISGDVSVIDTAADIVVDTLPAGLSIGSIFQQLGVTIPSGTTGGISGLLNGFLQGFLAGMSNPNTIGGAIGGGSGGLLSPGNLINGVLTGFLAYAGINQTMINSLNLPAFGIWSVSVAHNPVYLCSANVFMGNVGVTQIPNRSVNTMMGLTGIGPADVSAVWKR